MAMKYCSEGNRGVFFRVGTVAKGRRVLIPEEFVRERQAANARHDANVRARRNNHKKDFDNVDFNSSSR